MGENENLGHAPQQEQTIDLNQAFANISGVCAAYKGDLQEHNILQLSLKTIKEHLIEENKEVQ